jgi:serine/threonine protein kinase
VIIFPWPDLLQENCKLQPRRRLIGGQVTDWWYAEVIREKVQDGVTGETKDLQYTQCKIVGNGSFGVVFQTKLSPSGEDAAIKRVLQDKRFKVDLTALFSCNQRKGTLSANNIG